MHPTNVNKVQYNKASSQENIQAIFFLKKRRILKQAIFLGKKRWMSKQLGLTQNLKGENLKKLNKKGLKKFLVSINFQISHLVPLKFFFYFWYSKYFPSPLLVPALSQIMCIIQNFEFFFTVMFSSTL